MKIRLALLSALLLIPAAHAADAPSVDPRFLTFLKSDAHHNAVMKVATDQAKELPGACPSFQFRPVGTVDFFLPPRLDGQGRVTHGLWREQILAQGCSTVELLNVFSLAQPMADPKLLGGLPGTTQADPVLEKNGLPIAVKGLPDAAANCKDARVVDTELAPDAPKDRQSAWRETWIVLACDHAYPVPLRFTPTPDGATIELDQKPTP